MKKVLGLMTVVALSALMFTSCAKKCNCTRYEDGKKVSIATYNNGGTKFFNNTVCKNMSEAPEKVIQLNQCRMQRQVVITTN